MEESHRVMAENLFTNMCLLLTEHGHVAPTYFMIMKEEIIPIMISDNININFLQYQDLAEQTIKYSNPEAVMLIAEQFLIKRKKDDPDIQKILDGKLKPSQTSDREEFLTLMYVSIDNEKESLIGKIETDLIGTKFIRSQDWLDTCLTTAIKPWKEK